MIKHVKFVSVPTRDQEAALEFWTERVGFKVATDQPMGPGKRWIELLIPGATTRIVLFTPEGQEDRVGTFFNGSFACEDVEFTEPPTRQPWGTYAIFKDPDGNSFVLGSK